MAAAAAAAAAVGGGDWWRGGEGDSLTNLTVLAAQQNGPGGVLEGPDLSWPEEYNDSLATTPTPLPLGNTTATPPRDTAKKVEYCTEWSGATLTLFQVRWGGALQAVFKGCEVEMAGQM